MRHHIYLLLLPLLLRVECSEVKVKNTNLPTDTTEVPASQPTTLNPQLSAPITYKSADSLKVVQLLSEGSKLPKGTNLMVHYARQLRNIPYVAHTLEVNKNEQLIVNLRELDCTTYVETVTALTLCTLHGQHSFADYCKQLQNLRYRGGQLTDYTSRLHYFTDWIDDNTTMGYVKETQFKAPPFNSVQTIQVDFMSKHPQYYVMMKDNEEFLQVIARQEKNLCGRKYRYIPKNAVKNTREMRNAVKDGDIIAITTSKAGLDTSHIGIAVWHHDGLHLLNASQIHQKTIEEPMTMYQYMQKHPTQTGIRVVKVLGVDSSE